MLKTLPKKALQNISLSRGSNPIGSHQTLVERLSRSDRKGPFGIDLDAEQEENVLALIGVSDYQLNRYLTLEDKEPREEMLEKIFNEPLTKLSREIISYSRLPNRVLKKLAGNDFLPRSELIKIILNLRGTPPEFIENLQKQLSGLGFIIKDPPEELIPKPIDRLPFTPAGVRQKISEGFDLSTVPISSLRQVISDYLLFPRKLKDNDVVRIIKNVGTEPVLPIWPTVKRTIEDKKFEDLQELASYWGFDKLGKEEIEFLFSRGYLRNFKRAEEFPLDEASDLLIELLSEKYLEEDEEDLHKALRRLSDSEKEWLKVLFELDTLEFDDLIRVAQTHGISISYINNIDEFWTNAFNYANVNTSLSLTLNKFPRLVDKNLQKYSDFALIQWFPSAPYGRNKLIKKFIKYWEKEHWFFHDGSFYFGDWYKFEKREEPNWNDLEFEDLIDILGWLNFQPILRGNVLSAINWKLSEIDLAEQGLISKEEIPVEMKELFLEMVSTGTLSAGAEPTGPWPTEYGETNEEQLKEGINRVRGFLDLYIDEVLEKFPLISLKTLDLSSKTLKSLRKKKPDWKWVETGVFYLNIYFSSGITENNYILPRD